jgi:hypothetical protein
VTTADPIMRLALPLRPATVTNIISFVLISPLINMKRGRKRDDRPKRSIIRMM